MPSRVYILHNTSMDPSTLMNRCYYFAFVSIATTILLLFFYFWPQKPGFKVLKIDPDKSDPVHVTDHAAWTNWIVEAHIDNKNMFALVAESVEFKLFFLDHPSAPAAICEVHDLQVPARTASKVAIKMKVPLYSVESEIPNLIGECMSRKTIEAKVDMNIVKKVPHFLKLEFLLSFEEKLQCGLN